MKRKRGFTLIELLAVLVVLAIIALIAIPIVINIIADARANSNRRSIDSYGKAVDYAISRYMTDDYSNSDYSVIDKSKLKIDYSGKKVQCDVFEIGNDGDLTLSKCYVGNYSDKEIENLRKKEKWIKDEDGNPYTYNTEMHLHSEGVYAAGHKITFKGTDYWVIAESPKEQDYVVALKTVPFTVDELRKYGRGNINRHKSQDVYVDYHQDYNIGLMSYDDSDRCDYSPYQCSNSYKKSAVKRVIDNWVSETFTNDELKEVDGYKSRLITREELTSDLHYNNDNSNASYRPNSAPDESQWIYGEFSYWTMSPYYDYDSVIWFVSHDHLITLSVHPNGDIGAVRPVVNIKKSAIK